MKWERSDTRIAGYMRKSWVMPGWRIVHNPQAYDAPYRVYRVSGGHRRPVDKRQKTLAAAKRLVTELARLDSN